MQLTWHAMATPMLLLLPGVLFLPASFYAKIHAKLGCWSLMAIFQSPVLAECRLRNVTFCRLQSLFHRVYSFFDAMVF
jgi:hypothetical protein